MARNEYQGRCYVCGLLVRPGTDVDGTVLIRTAAISVAEARGRGDAKLRELARDVANSGVSFDDERLKYVEVQIDRETWDDLRAALGEQ